MWRVKHNTVNLPQNETDKEWQTFHDLHASLLLEVRHFERDESKSLQNSSTGSRRLALHLHPC